jgi:hypothetical protein
MIKYFLLPVLAVLLAACGTTPVAAPKAPASRPGVAVVEIGYLNHPPVRGVLTDVNKLLASYGGRVSVSWHNFDTDDGNAFAKAKGLTEHTPVAIFINGSMQFTLNGRTVKFYSFPQEQGTGMVLDGDWTMEDLRQVLDEATGKSS